MSAQSELPQINMYAFTGLDNVGDELSPCLVRSLIDCPINLVDIQSNHKMIAIGSVVCLQTILTATHFWGSGILIQEYIENLKIQFNKLMTFLMSDPVKFKIHLSNYQCTKYFALRGPLSAQGLKYAGIPESALPKVFGDPGILMPYIYQPKPTGKRYELGIILHHSQPEQEMIDYIEQHYGDKVKLVSVARQGEEQVHEFIDEMCSCDRIASVALHGLVLAQSYGIPTQFIQSANCMVYDNCVFKYNDYFLGTQQQPQTPVVFTTGQDLFDQLSKQKFHEPPKMRQFCQNLLDVFPYQDHLKLKSLPY